MYKNAITQAREEKNDWSPVMEKLTRKKVNEPGAWY